MGLWKKKEPLLDAGPGAPPTGPSWTHLGILFGVRDPGSFNACPSLFCPQHAEARAEGLSQDLVLGLFFPTEKGLGALAGGSVG